MVNVSAWEVQRRRKQKVTIRFREERERHAARRGRMEG